MFTNKKITVAMKYAMVVVVALVLVIGIAVFSSPIQEKAVNASGELSVIFSNGQEIYEYGTWFKADFNPINEVYYRQEAGGQSEKIDVTSYNWVLTNVDNSSLVYSGNQNSALKPAFAGNYRIRVTADSRYYDSDVAQLTYKASIAIGKKASNPFQKRYDGVTCEKSNDDWYDLTSHFDIIESKGMQGSISDYQLKLEWDNIVPDNLLEVGVYEYDLSVQKTVGSTITTYSYITYEDSSNEGRYKITKRPLLLDKDIVFAQKEKTHNGNALANGDIRQDEGIDGKYTYLKTDTKFGDESSRASSGLLPQDYDLIVSLLEHPTQYTPLLLFNGITVDDSTIDSYFMDSNGNPSSTVSATGPDGQIIYDKKIKLYYALNPAYMRLQRNYEIVRNTGTEASPIYTYYEEYAEFVEEEARILPGVFMLEVNQTSKEYGITTDDLNYELTQDASTVEEGNIAVSYAGDLLNETIGLRENGISGLRVSVKIGRLCEEYELEDIQNIDFMGVDSNNDEIYLMQYNRFTPYIGNFYFYVEVFYNGVRIKITQPTQGYSCGAVNMKFISTSFEVVPRKLFPPSSVTIETTKEYDGLLQAANSFQTSDFDSQWVVDQYYEGQTLKISDDSLYIEAVIKPVFNDINAGTDKIINVSYVIRLTEEGERLNKYGLLSNYISPDSYEIENCIITKKEIRYSFDMENAIDRPIYNDFLFPDDKVLIFEKAYNTPVPIIKELLFGEYILDSEGNVIYEDVYLQRPKTWVNEFGLVQNETDFFGNIIYESYGDPKLMPKRANYLLGNDNPYDLTNAPSGFDWEDAINWNYYCLEELFPAGHEFEGMQKSVRVSRYEEQEDGNFKVYIVDQNTPDVVMRSINQQTPPTGNPGIRIHIKEFYSDNYVYKPKTINDYAFFNITKKNPDWEMSENQEAIYNGKQHSSMTEDLSNGDVYDEIIKIELSEHGESAEIIGIGGKGIRIKVKQYAPIGQIDMYNVDTYSYEDIIKLIKIAGTYTIAVSLPETSTYKASKEIMLTLTILQVELTVYLSPSVRNYEEPNAPSSPLEYKESTDDLTKWGWRLYDDNFRSYRNTLLYHGFVANESPDEIGFGIFVNSYVDYGDVDETTTPGQYSISARGGSAHNYSFTYSFSAVDIIALHSEIIITQSEVNVTYDPEIESWRVNEYEAGVDDPLAAYTYTADDNSQVDVSVAGFKPLGEEYDFSLHYIYLIDDNGEIVYDSNNNPIVIEFSPKIIKVDGEWVPYAEGLTGEILDCTPPERYKKAKFVGQYIMRLTATAIYYQSPDPKVVKFNIGYAETEVEITEGIIIHEYDGSWFRINGVGSNEEAYNFITNNKEIKVFIKVLYSQKHFDEVGATFVEILSKTPYINDDIDTKVEDSGYYKIMFMFEYYEYDDRNFNVPQESEYMLRVQVKKGEVKLSFSGGEQNWVYRGAPYELLDNGTMQSSDLGVIYSVIPEVPFDSIIVEVYKYDSAEELSRVTGAIDVGKYLFRLMASGESTENYDDSEWIEKDFEITKASINVNIRGKKIAPESSERYPLQKIYGEEVPQNNFEVYYTGWIKDEDPESSDPNKIPSGFEKAKINWNQVTQFQNARPDTPYSLTPFGASSHNYKFVYNAVSFYILKAQGEIIVNEEYTTAIYTGVEQTRSSTFRNGSAPEEGAPFAFSLNYDPRATEFRIEIVGKKIYDEMGEFEINNDITSCIDVGEYVFLISASASENYMAVLPTQYSFSVIKAELKAFISDAQITYGEAYPVFELNYTGYVGKDISTNAPIYDLYEDTTFDIINGRERVQNLIHPILVIPTDAIDYRSGGYTINLAGGSSTNYWINVDDTANLEIRKKDITIKSAEIIIKQYNGKNDANSYVSQQHYQFVGVIRHYLKNYSNPNDIDSIGLVFQARFDSAEVGRRIVKMQELTINNTNYNLTTVEFECDGQITKLEPQISYNPKSFTYDGTQKRIEPVVKGLPGDEVEYLVHYKGVGPTTYMESLTPPTIAGNYEAIVTTNDPNYSDKNYPITMVINKARVEITFPGDRMQTYGSVTGLSARAKGIDGYSQAITVKYYDMNDNPVENILIVDQGEYKAVATYNATANYLSAESVEVIVIRQQEVDVNIDTSLKSYVYDGKMKHQNAEFYIVNNEIEKTLISYAQIINGEEVFINIDDDGKIIPTIAPRNVGLYKMYAISPSENYILVGDLTSTFEIVIRELNIKVNDIIIKNGENPFFTYSLDGIAIGDTINTLSQKPTIQYFDEYTQSFLELSTLNNGIIPVGKYRIKPNNASDGNYEITYTEGKMIVNAVQLIANTIYSSGLLIEGAFSPESNLNVKVLQTGVLSKASTTYEVFKMNNEEYKGTSLSNVYDISITSGALIAGNTMTIKLMLEAGLTGELLYRVAHIKPDGSVEIIEINDSDGEYLIFDVSELGHFSVLVESDNKTRELWVYVAIAGAILIILIGIIIIKKKA